MQWIPCIGGRAPDAADAPRVKLPRPKDLPAQIGKHLVVHQKLDPDWVWSLKCVVRPRSEDKRYFDFRVYDPKQAEAKAFVVRNYDSLEDQPTMTLCEGRYHKDMPEPIFTRQDVRGAAA